MRYHFIAIGGAVMHQMALHLHHEGHKVSGSDDAIFDPAKTNLDAQGLLPETYGWHPDTITSDIDAIILGMHAKADNPELIQAQKLGLKIYSFPEFIFENSKDKIRIVIAGSNGKTTTTSMIMHQFKEAGIDFDYLVGSKISGFDCMVKTSSSAQYIIIEGDEYLTSPLDLRSKFLHYKPHIAVITSIDWDHINVFPTFESYLDTFRQFISDVQEEIFYFGKDEVLTELVESSSTNANKVAYDVLKYKTIDNTPYVYYNGKDYPSSVFGEHNFANWNAALHVCRSVGISEVSFFSSMNNFSGAARRMEKVYVDLDKDIFIFRDFAHAPAKLKATVNAVRNNFPEHIIVGVYELHTFSSMQEDFIPQYHNSMMLCDIAAIYMDQASFELKGKKLFDSIWLSNQFGSPYPQVLKNKEELQYFLLDNLSSKSVYLMMSSGHLGGWKVDELIEYL